MQTFLPYKDYVLSASCLDNKRLGKQRVEVKQLYKALTEPDYGWKSHPCTKLWKGYEFQLLLYGIAVCTVWRSRGFKDTLLKYFIFQLYKVKFNPEKPKWLTWEFCLRHRSNLIRKKPEHYLKLWPCVPDNLPYIWEKE